MASKLDIVVVGATGYTGRITCKYLAKHKESFTWGIAGRNEKKLNALKNDLGPDASSVKTFVVDVSKPESLDAVCKRAICVISCAGPFNVCGMPVVEACVRNGTHYIDSTGEFNFVRLVAERFHEEAKKKKIVLASCCGFDSVPADIGNYVTHRDAGEELTEVRCIYECNTAGISSGTAHSIGQIMSHMSRADLSPTSLNPVGAEYKKPISAQTRHGLWYDRAVRSWTAPFAMSACNERVVRRTNALMGSSAAYVECIQGTFLASLAATAATYLMGLILAIPPVRNYLLRRLFPSGRGYGPSEEKKKGSYFHCVFLGTTVSGRTLRTVIHSPIDMYDVTGVFLSECALSAVHQQKHGKVVAGVQTAASAFGDDLVFRASKAGIIIKTFDSLECSGRFAAVR